MRTSISNTIRDMADFPWLQGACALFEEEEEEEKHKFGVRCREI